MIFSDKLAKDPNLKKKNKQQKQKKIIFGDGGGGVGDGVWGGRLGVTFFLTNWQRIQI